MLSAMLVLFALLLCADVIFKKQVEEDSGVRTGAPFREDCGSDVI